jgi:hypothetical protein
VRGGARHKAFRTAIRITYIVETSHNERARRVPPDDSDESGVYFLTFLFAGKRVFVQRL